VQLTSAEDDSPRPGSATVLAVEDLLKAVGALVAVVASLAAVALAVDQFTVRSRLRKSEEWAAEALVREVHGNRAPVLANIRLDATAGIVASLLVPAGAFVPYAAAAAVSVSVVALALAEPGNVSTAAPLLVVLVLSTTVLSVVAWWRLVRLYFERRRVASEFRRGLVVERPQRVGLTIREVRTAAFGLGVAIGLSTCVAAAGVGLAFTSRSAGGWPLLVMFFGALVAAHFVDGVGRRARRRYPLRETSADSIE
jgi:hypothetical protein